jgi:hypothetical protein
VGELREKIFPQVLISNELEIICKVMEGIYTPGEYRGGGGECHSGNNIWRHFVGI